jgi:hypothetical protein
MRVRKPAFGTFDGDMSHESLGRLWAETVRYPLVEAFVDRDVLNKRVQFTCLLTFLRSYLGLKYG